LRLSNNLCFHFQLQAFFDENEGSLGGVRPSVEGALKTIDENMKWQTEHKQVVIEHMQSSAALAILSPILLLATFITKLFN
jgi:hypothetical protein